MGNVHKFHRLLARDFMHSLEHNRNITVLLLKCLISIFKASHYTYNIIYIDLGGKKKPASNLWTKLLYYSKPVQ